MSNCFVIGDLHFGHEKVAKLRGFADVQEHNEALVSKWNARVDKRDTVYVLGDVLFGAGGFQWLALLRGQKKLIAGNHDEYPTERYLQHFAKVVGCAEVNGWLLTHIPVHPSQLARWPLNVHGHMHSNCVLRDPAYPGEEHPGYFCASAERIDLTPISIAEIEQKIKERQ